MTLAAGFKEGGSLSGSISISIVGMDDDNSLYAAERVVYRKHAINNYMKAGSILFLSYSFQLLVIIAPSLTIQREISHHIVLEEDKSFKYLQPDIVLSHVT